MNLILFEKNEITQELSRDDPRAVHVLSVLRCKKGDAFDVGIVNGPRGKGIIYKITPASLFLEFIFPDKEIKENLYPVVLVVGLPRPQTARKILREVTALGVSKMYFIGTDKGEDSYGKSRLWTSGEVRKHLIAGAEQAFSTLLPEVLLFNTLQECISNLPLQGRIALDNYEAVISLKEYPMQHNWISLLVGPEKGWSGVERDILRKNRCTLAGLGKRVLRTETAAVAGITLVLAGMGFI